MSFPLFLLLFVLTGCQGDEPVRIGFIGGMTSHYSVLGIGTRNGVLLAIEEANAAGGIQGRRVELIVRDDKQNPQVARAAVAELLALDVDVIIGPTTSSIAMSVVDLANAGETLMVGTSVSTSELSGIDDYFVRIMSPTSYSANCLGTYLHSQLGLRRFVAIYDERNLSFAESWLGEITRLVEAEGSGSLTRVPFSSGKIDNLVGVAEQALASDPQVVLLVTTSVDAAALVKQIKTESPQIQIATAETERLIELAGRYMEGAVVPQNFVAEDGAPDFARFRESYLRRFNHEPGTAGILGFDAARLALRGLNDESTGTDLKSNILKISQFEGIQGNIRLDSFGDANNRTRITRVENGSFKVQDFQCPAQ